MFWNQFIENETIVQIVTGIGILLLFLVFRKIFSTYLFPLLLKFTNKTNTKLVSSLLIAFEKPIRLLIVVVGIFLSLQYFPYYDFDQPFFYKLLRSTIIIIITWGLYKFSSTSSAIFESLKKRFHVEVDQLLIPFLSKGLRFVIIAISITIIAEEFDYNINGFITGLGLGGLAVALAAKDALANFLGGVVIIFEKPFSIGDWIMTPSVEGTVEDITFRSTKVRTFAQALVTVPNSTLANQPITNWSKMGKRQITFNLEVYYTSIEKLERAINRMEQMLKNHPGIHPETIYVKFDKIHDGKMVIFFYFFTNTTVFGEYLQIKQEINFNIIKILEEEQIQPAYVTQPIILGNQDKEKNNDQTKVNTVNNDKTDSTVSQITSTNEEKAEKS